VAEQVRQFDHLDPAAAQGIHSFLAGLRRYCPVARSERHGGFFVVASQDAIVEVGKDHRRFSSAVAGLGAVMLLPEWDETHALLFELDPPEHTAWRKIMQPFFTPEVAAAYEPHITEITRKIVNELRPRGQGDFVRDLAVLIPVLVVARMLGIPRERHDEFSRVARTFFAAGSLPPEQARSAVEQYLGFLQEQVRGRRGHNGDDLLTRVINAKVGDQAPTELQQVKFAFLMVAAGHLTTVDTIANTLLVLARDQELRQRIITDPALIPALIEESVRYESSVAATGRAVLEPTMLAGVALRRGDKLLLTWGSGTRDEKYFTDADQFRLERHQGRQLAWGAGVHRCLGRHLARVELGVVIREVLHAMPDYRLALAPGEQVETTYGVIRGVRSMPVTWTP
jgi:cytochrome P450